MKSRVVNMVLQMKGFFQPNIGIKNAKTKDVIGISIHGIMKVLNQTVKLILKQLNDFKSIFIFPFFALLF